VKYDLIIVRIGEIALKAKATRKRFENTLVNNIRNALRSRQISFKIKREWGRYFVYTGKINQSIDVLQKIFGITSTSPAMKTQGDLQVISKIAVDISKENITKKKSFALRVERTGRHSFSSQDAAVEIGNNIVQATKASVDLTHPDFELFIEIRDEHAYLFTEKTCCAGGLPLRTQGNVLVLIDSMNSILAAWYIMRRGCKPVFISKNKSVSSILSRFISNWFADENIIMFDTKKPIYDYINKTAEEKDCSALVTGHNLYDASNKTLSDIRLLNNNIHIPVLHPLIAMETDFIQKKCDEIGII
jgi:thiamine biosynthesis protein ThiI